MQKTKLFENKIVVNETGKIIKVFQQITPENELWTLSHEINKFNFSFKNSFLNLIISFSISLIFSIILVLTFNFHSNLSKDTVQGPQKIHKHLTPRVGGISILLLS